jgi:dipeptidase E
VPSPRIFAVGGAYFGDSAAHALHRFVASLTNRKRPRVCFLPTATGDHPVATTAFYRAATAIGATATDLQLFYRDTEDLRAALLAQDVIWVAGGNTANALAVWRVHGVDAILREAWEQGIVLTGSSAGMICWFESAVTDSFSITRLAPLHDGLGFLPGSACPHYDGEPQRRPTYTGLIKAGVLPPGHAADDGVGILFEGTERVDVVGAREGSRAYYVDADGEHVLDVRAP